MLKGEIKLTVNAFLWSRQEDVGRQQFKLGSVILTEAL